MDAGDDDTVTMPTANGGWCAPGLSQLWAVLPGVELPEIKMRRGGIQWPMNMVESVGFFARRRGWHRAEVILQVRRTWTHYGETKADESEFVIARFWRQRHAWRCRDLADKFGWRA